jgi:hypothetical protein
MHIDKFKKEDGYYYKDGCSYEDAESFIQSTILGFCNCGRPWVSLEFIAKCLKQVDIYHDSDFDEWQEENSKIIGDEGVQYFAWYFLHSKDLSEHGGSVPGWLTMEGKELLEDLQELIPIWDKEKID